MATMKELLKGNNNQETIIANHLIQYSMLNGWNKVEETQQKISDCMKYIKNQARKQADNGVAMIEDTVVFQWAIDFYNGAKAKEENKEVEEKPIKKEEKKDEQLSLF